MILRLRRGSFIFMTLALGGGLCLLLSGVACLSGRSDISISIGWAFLISLLCFIPSYYALVWAFNRSGQAILAAMCLGLPVRFGVAFGTLFILDKLSLIEPNPAGLWLCVFYTLFLIMESISLAQEPVNRWMAPADLKEGC